MSATWTIVLVVGLGTIAIKGLGPVLLGGRPLPPRVNRMIALLAPALLAALVAINTMLNPLASEQDLVLDARLPGVLAAAVAIKLKAPVLVVVIVAAVVTAGIRAIAG
jgi:branched-subunit amino acid transport protein